MWVESGWTTDKKSNPFRMALHNVAERRGRALYAAYNCRGYTADLFSVFHILRRDGGLLLQTRGRIGLEEKERIGKV